MSGKLIGEAGKRHIIFGAEVFSGISVPMCSSNEKRRSGKRNGYWEQIWGMGRRTAVSFDCGHFCQIAIITHILCTCEFMYFLYAFWGCVRAFVCFKLVNLCVASNGQPATVRLHRLANGLATACQDVCLCVCLRVCLCACVRMHVAKKEKSCP